MPCYRCGTRQGDPEPGKSSPWRRGVVREHQVLICPACQPAALAELSRCPGCGSAHLVRRLDQVECLDCRLTRDADDEDPASRDDHRRGTADSQGTADGKGTADNKGTADSRGTAHGQGTADSQGTAHGQGTADSQGTAHRQGTADISDMSGISDAPAPDIPDEPRTGAPPAARDPGLAAEVARALARVLGRG